MAEKTTAAVTNREYKSDVFSMLMEIPEYALQVYNSLNGTNHQDPAELEMKCLDKGIYLSIRNDASFVLDSYLNLYEHQSTVCPNMPLRCLIYTAGLFEDLVKHRDLFSSKLIRIPAPRYVVFYNGLQEQPDEQILKLSDAYEPAEPDIHLELICQVVNVNPGHSPQFLGDCRIMYEYSCFIDEVRRQEGLARQEQNPFLREKEFANVLNRAIDICIEKQILEDFLKKHRSEVLRMTTLDYSFERRLELSRNEALQTGLAEGIEQGKQQGIEQGIEQGKQQGIEQGIEQGKQQGVGLLFSAVMRLKKGETSAEIIASGFPESIVEKALLLYEN